MRMKLLICILLLFTHFGYSQNFNPFKKKITINFSSGFNNCYVKFSLNEKIIFEETIDTEWSTGLAHSVDIYVPRFKKKLKFKLVTCQCAMFEEFLELANNFNIEQYDNCDFLIIKSKTRFEFY